MGDLIGAALILVVGIPLVLAVYFGWKFVKQARLAARSQARVGDRDSA